MGKKLSLEELNLLVGTNNGKVEVLKYLGKIKMENQYYDGSYYGEYRRRWIEKNFPDRFRKYKNKIYEVEE